MNAPRSFDPDTAVEVRVPRALRRDAELGGWLLRADGRQAQDFVITNISFGGCNLRTGASLVPGEPVTLTVYERGAIRGIVRWRKGERVGIEFADESEQAGRSQHERAEPRLAGPVEVLVRRQGRHSQWIEAGDVSPRGCRLHFVTPPQVGDSVFVLLPGLQALGGKVRWVEGHDSGIVFNNPIHSAVFDLLRDRWSELKAER